MKLRALSPALLALAALPLQAAGCHAKPLSQIVLVVQSDMSIPKDIDTIRIQAFNNGTLKLQQDYDKIGPDHTYDTPVYRRGNVTSIGILQGDLFLTTEYQSNESNHNHY